MSERMTPSRPYMMKALHEWILDNKCTPYLLVDASLPAVQVPQDYINNGQIVLNINPSAIHGLLIDQQGVSFSARFGGVPMEIFVPLVAVMAIYAKENGEGMVFGSEPGSPDPDEPPPPNKEPAPSNNGRPSLKVVK
ncbi:MAG: ClpXP protease specificity-enhancing factor [Oleibacter sp.]|nr:ClpXP protease specificity-enhancing factor [Thalassolituus sp.]